LDFNKGILLLEMHGTNIKIKMFDYIFIQQILVFLEEMEIFLDYLKLGLDDPL
jgi:hypothetical protein